MNKEKHIKQCSKQLNKCTKEYHKLIECIKEENEQRMNYNIEVNKLKVLLNKL